MDDLLVRERELKKRWAYLYRWGRVQNDRYDVSWLQTIVRDYMRAFDAHRLWRFSFASGVQTLSDIIWALHVDRQ